MSVSLKPWAYAPAVDWCIRDLFLAVPGAPFRAKAVARLENTLKEVLGVAEAVTTDMGRTALQLGLHSLGLGNQEAVLVPALVCPTVIAAIINAGCVPVFVDSHKDDLHVSVETLEASWLPEVKAALVPHLYGLNAPIAEIEGWCESKGIFLIDDAAQIFKKNEDGRYFGTYGDIGIYSFGPYKGLGSTRGGAVVSKKNGVLRKYPVESYATESLVMPFRRVVSGYFKFCLRNGYVNYRCNDNKISKIETNYSKYKIDIDLGYRLLSGYEANIVTSMLGRLNKITSTKERAARIIIDNINKNNYMKLLSCGGNSCSHILMALNNKYETQQLIVVFKEHGIVAKNIYCPVYKYNDYKKYVNRICNNAERHYSNTILLPNLYDKDEAVNRRLSETTNYIIAERYYDS